MKSEPGHDITVQNQALRECTKIKIRSSRHQNLKNHCYSLYPWRLYSCAFGVRPAPQIQILDPPPRSLTRRWGVVAKKTDEKSVFVSERNLTEADPLFTITYSVAGPETARQHAAKCCNDRSQWTTETDNNSSLSDRNILND